MNYKKKGEKVKYGFLDHLCIGRSCFAPGHFQHRAPTFSGSRNTGSPDTPCCMTRAYHGCPTCGERPVEIKDGIVQATEGILLPFDKTVAAERKKAGWKLIL